MKNRFVLYRRGSIFYCDDRLTGKPFSLKERDEKRARAIVEAKNAADKNPDVELAKAEAVIEALNPDRARRTWQCAMAHFEGSGKKESSRLRKKRALAQPVFDPIRHKRFIDTTPEDLLAVMKAGGSMVNQYLKCLQNIALSFYWISRPVLPPGKWPEREKQPKRRAITREEHERILASEQNSERRRYYEILWETGAAQTDAANFGAHNVDWENNVFSYTRIKTGERATITIGKRFETLLRSLAAEGLFFPSIQKSNDKWRAAEFCRRRKLAGVSGVSLHCYRYAWAQRARAAGYPRRWAEAALGHNCPAVHDAYANDDSIVCPSLEEYEGKIISLVAPPKAVNF